MADKHTTEREKIAEEILERVGNFYPVSLRPLSKQDIWYKNMIMNLAGREITELKKARREVANEIFKKTYDALDYANENTETSKRLVTIFNKIQENSAGESNDNHKQGYKEEGAK